MVHLDDAVRARLAQIVEEIDASTFRESKWGHRGYNERDVDEFLDYLIDVIAGLIGVPADQVVAAVSDAAPVAAQPSGVTVQDAPGDVAGVTWETRPSQVAVIAEPPTDTSAIVEEETAMWSADAEDTVGEYTGEYTGQFTGEYTGQLTGEHVAGQTGEHTGEYTGEYTGEFTAEHDGEATGADAGAADDSDDADETGPDDAAAAGAAPVRTAFPPPPPWAGGS